MNVNKQLRLTPELLDALNTVRGERSLSEEVRLVMQQYLDGVTDIVPDKKRTEKRTSIYVDHAMLKAVGDKAEKVGLSFDKAILKLLEQHVKTI